MPWSWRGWEAPGLPGSCRLGDEVCGFSPLPSICVAKLDLAQRLCHKDNTELIKDPKIISTWELYYPRLNWRSWGTDQRWQKEAINSRVTMWLYQCWIKARILQTGSYKRLTNSYLPTEGVDRPNQMANKMFLMTDIIHFDFPISMIWQKCVFVVL